MSGITLDAGGLIALDRNHRRVLVLARPIESGMRVTVPATALAQAVRNPARQARLSRLVRHVSTDLVPLDGPDAAAVGLLIAQTQTSEIAGAHVAFRAQRTGQAVVTSGPEDLKRLPSGLRLVVI